MGIRFTSLERDLQDLIMQGLGGGGRYHSLLQRGPSGREGKVYYVNQDNGSDSFEGASPEKPFATIAKAVTVMNDRIGWSDSPWSQKDMCYVYPGVYAENLTAMPYGGALIGLGHWWDANGEFGVVIKPTSGAPIDVTSMINSWLENMWIESPDASPVFQADTFNRNVMLNVHLQGLPGASNTTTKGFETVKDCTGNLLLGVSTFQVNNGFYLVVDNVDEKQVVGTIFKSCIAGGVDVTGMYVDVNANPAFSFLLDCILGDNSMTCATPFDDNSGKMTAIRSYFIGTTIDPATGSGLYQGCYHNGSLVA